LHDYGKLKEQRLAFDHFRRADHIHVFDKKDLKVLLSKHFNEFCAKEGEPIVFKADPALIISPWLNSDMLLMRKNLGGVKMHFELGVNYRLYGIIDVI
jgi:hypothetical protein